jgi:hypothetical protein
MRVHRPMRPSRVAGRVAAQPPFSLSREPGLDEVGACCPEASLAGLAGKGARLV